MAAQSPRRRASRIRTAAYRRRLFARQTNPLASRERPIFRRRRGRWTAARLCFFGAAALLAGAVSFSMLSFPPAAADIDAEKRAAQDVASLQEDVSHPQRSASLEVPALAQNLGFNLGKTDIADNWLPLSEDDFVTAFMGDPHSTDGHSCMAPAIVRTADAYLAAQGSSLEATDITGSSLDQVLDQVAGGNPVIAWCTIGLEPPGAAYRTARENGRTYRLYANSHCVVVSGYDLNEGLVLVSDSLAGQVSYDLQQFAVRYYELGAQAVVIE